MTMIWKRISKARHGTNTRSRRVVGRVNRNTDRVGKLVSHRQLLPFASPQTRRHSCQIRVFLGTAPIWSYSHRYSYYLRKMLRTVGA